MTKNRKRTCIDVLALLALITALLLAFVGCGKKQNDINGDDNSGFGDEVDEGNNDNTGGEDEPTDEPEGEPGDDSEKEPENGSDNESNGDLDDEPTDKPNNQPAATGSIIVSTKNTYSYTDSYSFTASVSGTYTFTIPAGLGFISSAAYKPEVDFQLSPGGGTAEIDLEKGAVLNFSVGAATRSSWTISWSVIEGEVEMPVEPSYDIVMDANDEDGYTLTYTATEKGNLVVTVADLAYDYLGNGHFVVANADALSLGFPRMYSLIINGVTFKHYTATVAVEAGDEITIQLYCNYGYATKANIETTLTSGGGNSSGVVYPEDNIYGIVIDENDSDGYSFTYTAVVAGELNITVNSLDYDYVGDGEYISADSGTLTYGFSKMYALLINGTNVGSSTASLKVNAGDKITIQLYSHNGYATKAQIVVGYNNSSDKGQAGNDAPLGSETNPIHLEAFPESIIVNSDSQNFTYYVITAQKSGTVRFTWPTADSWYMITELNQDGTNTANGISGYNTESFSFEITQGTSYAVSLGSWSFVGNLDITIEIVEN